MSFLDYLSSPVFTRLVITLTHFLWQGMAVAAVALTAARLAGRRSSNIRYGIYVLSLFAMVLCVGVTFIVVKEPVILTAQKPSTSAPVFSEEDAVAEEPGDMLEFHLADQSGEGAFGTPVEHAVTTEAEEPEEAIPSVVEEHPAADAEPSLAVQASSTDRSPFDWRCFVPYVVGIYLLGVFFMMVRLLVAFHGGRRLRCNSKPVTDSSILSLLSKQCRALGLAFTPAIAYCRRVLVPTVVGVIKPTVLLPFSFASTLSLEQVEMLLSHELAHIRRHDLLIDVIQRIIEALLFFHPAVWWVSRMVRIERENCCDDMVLAAGGKAREYASSLVDMAEQTLLSDRKSPVAAAKLNAVGRFSQLRQRVVRLMRGTEHDRMRVGRVWVTGLAILAVACLTTTWFVGIHAEDGKDEEKVVHETDEDTESREPNTWVCEGGPYGGQVGALAIDPHNSHVLYAGGPGGLYKSVDGAAHWMRVDSFQREVQDIALDASDSRIIYLTVPNWGGGLHKSVDGGRSWTRLDPKNLRMLKYVETDPKDSGIVYAFDDLKGLFKSTDGGTTWERKRIADTNPELFYLRVDRNSPQKLHGAALPKAVFRSRDGGINWEKTASTIRKDVSITALKKDPKNRKRFEIHLSVGKETVVYESTNKGQAWHSREGGELKIRFGRLVVRGGRMSEMEIPVYDMSTRDVFLSNDGSETWRLLSLPFEGRKLMAIRSDSSQRGILYAGTRDDIYYYSDDKGKTWEFYYSAESDPKGEQTDALKELKTLFQHGIGSGDFQPMFRSSLVGDPSDSDVAYYIDYSRGLHKTEDYGKKWIPATTGLTMFKMRGIVCDRTRPGLVYAYSHTGAFRSVDGGKTWEGMRPYLLYLSVHPCYSRLLLAVKQMRDGVGAISEDGGQTWREMPGLGRGSGLNGFVFDSKDAERFYALSTNGILETRDRGLSWELTDSSRKMDFKGFRRVRQTVADILYLVDKSNRKILRTTDVGKSWEEVIPGLDRDIRFVQIHPSDPKILVVTDDRGDLVRSLDAGETWHAIKLPDSHRGAVNCIGMDPINSDVFFVGMRTTNTILRTGDGGKTFEELNGGLPGRPIAEIVVSPADGTVYAATNGCGVYRLVWKEPTEGGVLAADKPVLLTDHALEGKLETRLPKVRFVHAKFEEVINYLSTKLDMAIILDEQVRKLLAGDAKRFRVTIDPALRNVEFQRLLEVILEPKGLAYTVEGFTIRIVADDIERDVEPDRNHGEGPGPGGHPFPGVRRDRRITEEEWSGTPQQLAKKVKDILEGAEKFQKAREDFLRREISKMTDDELMEAYHALPARRKGKEPEPLSEEERENLLEKLKSSRGEMIEELVKFPPGHIETEMFRQDFGFRGLSKELEELGARAVPVILKEIKDWELTPSKRIAFNTATRALRKIGKPARDAALKSYRTATPAQKRVFLEVLSLHPEPAAMEIFLEAAKAPGKEKVLERLQAIRWLDRFGDERAIDTLIEGLKDPFFLVRRQAIWGLARAGDLKAIPGLKKVAKTDVVPEWSRMKKHKLREEANWAILSILRPIEFKMEIRFYEEIIPGDPEGLKSKAKRMKYTPGRGRHEMEIVIKPEPVLTEKDMVSLRMGERRDGKYYVTCLFESSASREYSFKTAALEERRVAVVVNGKVTHTTSMRSLWSGSGTLVNGVTREEAIKMFPELAKVRP